MGDPEHQRLIAGLVLCGLLSLPALRLLGRTGEERWIGIFFLASGIGFGARVAAVSSTGISPWLNGLGHAGLSLACVALYRFTRRVFRPTSTAARWAEGCGILASLATFVAVVVGDGLLAERSPSVIAANFVRLCSYAWSFAEALRYWTLMRRRVGLGLADPLVANRFGLWSIWMAGLTSMLGIVLVLRLVGFVAGVTPAEVDEAMPQVLQILRGVLATTALVSGVAVWLTFFPPRFYARRLARSTT